MTTLAVDVARAFELGDLNDIGAIATDIIYEGAAVGMSAGYARPLVGGDKFLGFCLKNATNTGAAGAVYVTVRQRGQAILSVSGAVITDVGQPVYATDDNTFVFLPTGASFIGFVKRFVSAGVVIVEFDVARLLDPYFGKLRQTLSAATLTLDAQDSGKDIFCTVDTVITLPATAVALRNVRLICMGPDGTVQVSVDPDAADKLHGPDDTGADGGVAVNTKATAVRGDYITVTNGHADGATVDEIKGIWTIA